MVSANTLSTPDHDLGFKSKEHNQTNCFDHLHIHTEIFFETLKMNDMPIYGIIKKDRMISFFAPGVNKQTFALDQVIGVGNSEETVDGYRNFFIYLKSHFISLSVKSEDIEYIKTKWQSHWNLVLDNSDSVCVFYMESTTKLNQKLNQKH